MKLAKLLGTGKSFFGGYKSAVYRPNKQAYLPKFNAEKNPFTPKAPESVPAAAKTQKIPFMPAVRTEPAARSARAAGWTARLNPFRPSEPVPLPMVNAVQAELSLDAVKVLHNDLSDADVEVVPVKSRSGSSSSVPPGLLGGQRLNTV